MRIWDFRLLPYLPELQFKGQLRELVAIMRDWRDKGETNHILINRVMEYPKSHLTYYFILYDCIYFRRYGTKHEKYLLEFIDFSKDCKKIDRYDKIFEGWHNKTYLDICMYNILEKHLGIGNSRVSDYEWDILCLGYKKITGEEFIY